MEYVAAFLAERKDRGQGSTFDIPFSGLRFEMTGAGEDKGRIE
jgi:hypothetical protein